MAMHITSAGFVEDQIRGKIEELDGCIEDAEHEIRENLKKLERIGANIRENKKSNNIAILNTEGIIINVEDYQELIAKFKFAKEVLTNVLKNK